MGGKYFGEGTVELGTSLLLGFSEPGRSIERAGGSLRCKVEVRFDLPAQSDAGVRPRDTQGNKSPSVSLR